jgi:hypothetical protein
MMKDVGKFSETLDFYSELILLDARDFVRMGLTYILVLLSENKLSEYYTIYSFVFLWQFIW